MRSPAPKELARSERLSSRLTTGPRPGAVLAGALLAALVLVPATVLVVATGFDGRYGQDAFSYVAYALGPLTEAIRRLAQPPEFFWPPGYPLLVALAALATDSGPRAGQLVSLVAGCSVPPLTAGLVYELADGLPSVRRSRVRIALIAGAVAGMSGQLWQSSVVSMSDTTALALATGGAWAACRYLRRPSAGWATLAGVLFGLAVQTRVNYGLVVVPFAVAGLYVIAQQMRNERRAGWRVITAVGQPALALAGAAAAMSPTLAAWASAALAGEALPFLGQFGVHSWQPLTGFSSTIVTANGRFDYALPTGLFYLLQPVAHYWFFVLGVFVVPGLQAVLRAPSPARIAALIAWPGMVVAFLAGIGDQNTRFFLAAMPPAAALVALGVLAIGHRVIALAARRRIGSARRAVVALLTMLLLANGVLAARHSASFVGRQMADLQAIAELAALVPPDGRIISLGPTPALRAAGTSHVVELYELDVPAALTLATDGQPTFLLVHLESIHGQWAALSPADVVRALEAGPGLVPVTRRGIYTLFRVGRRAGLIQWDAAAVVYALPLRRTRRRRRGELQL